jgi:putative hemolysin
MAYIKPITYSNHGPLGRRIFIALLEYLTGRLTLERKYRDVSQAYNRNPDKPFFDHAIDALNIEINYPLLHPSEIPGKTPLLVVANHPFGILDGLLMNHILYQSRNDFKILTNEVLTRAVQMSPWLISIDDSQTAEGKKKNNRAIRESMERLRDGGCISIFPAGRLARPHRFGADVTDWDWQPLVGHLAKRTKINDGKDLMILPVFFEGRNSSFFRLAACMKLFTITRSLVIYELLNKRKSKVSVKIGNPVKASDISGADAEEITANLRAMTLGLK